MEYILHLSKDKKLKKLIDGSEAHQLIKRKNICTYLCASIMSQQLSTKVARVIHQRFLNLYGGKEPTPQQIVEMPFESLRGIGLSNAKVGYVKNPDASGRFKRPDAFKPGLNKYMLRFLYRPVNRMIGNVQFRNFYGMRSVARQN